MILIAILENPIKLRIKIPARVIRFLVDEYGSSVILIYINPGIITAMIVPQNPPTNEKINRMFGKNIATAMVTKTQLRVMITCLNIYYSHKGVSLSRAKHSFSIDNLHGFSCSGTPIVSVSEIRQRHTTIAQSFSIESGAFRMMTISGVFPNSDMYAKKLIVVNKMHIIITDRLITLFIRS